MLDSITNAFRIQDLRKRILYTLGVLAIYRFAAHIPVPGVDQAALESFFQGASAQADVSRFLNLLSGGALESFSVVAMGVYPYITASIIMQLMVPIVPSLEELSKEGEQGRNKINQYTYYLTIPLAVIQAIAQVALMNTAAGGGGQIVEFGPEVPLNTLTLLLALTAGTAFALWLGEQITEEGIGNGVSIIIFGGIVATIPQNLLTFLTAGQWVALFVVTVLTIVTVAGIVVIQEGHRRIPVQYGKRVRGQKVYGGQSTHIPLRVNSAGMIPLIFASSLLIIPGFIGQFLSTADGLPLWLQSFGQQLSLWFGNQGGVFFLGFFVLTVLFTFFYTDVVFRQQNLSETLQRQGGFIPGIRPGRRTDEYLTAIMHRITLAGAFFLGLVAVLPWFAELLTNLPANQSLLITSFGLLIVVGVVLDTIKQLEAQLLMRHYEGFIK